MQDRGARGHTLQLASRTELAGDPSQNQSDTPDLLSLSLIFKN